MTLQDIPYILTSFWYEYWWLFVLTFLGCLIWYLWLEGRLSLVYVIVPLFLCLVLLAQGTGWFSSYDLTRRSATFIYTDEQYRQQMDTWIADIEQSKGRCVGLFTCPQVSENGTRYLWVEIAYQPGKIWYEPVGIGYFK